jgi:transcriptional regulator with PAS, ATPase and Fis domain
LSTRSQGPFNTLDCSAIPKELIESELFGHEKGAFTTAVAQRKGAFELARGGSIFLDEIGELPLEMQPKLLRVLEERTFKRVGGNEVLRSDFRIIAATNRWLDQEVLQGRFRQDLYFRLYVLPIFLPPLRERKEDIPLLVSHFLKGKAVRVLPATLEKLTAHDWPGNVRELRNVIERGVVMAEGETLQPDDLLFLQPSDRQGPPMPWEEQKKSLPSGSLEEIEKQVIERTLKAQGGDKKAAAQILGIALSTLYEKLKRHRIAD